MLLRLMIKYLVIAWLLFPLLSAAKCQDIRAPHVEQPLTIAVKFLPPFVFEASAVTNNNGGWHCH